MEKHPKILILGNGFDLAHYLPTSYTHFMKAMMVLEESEEDTEISFDELFSEYIKNNNWFINKTKEIYKTDELVLSVDIANKLRKELKENHWFTHFKNHLNNIDTWIDFEQSINQALISICRILEIEFSDLNANKSSVFDSESFIIEESYLYKKFGAHYFHTMDNLLTFEVFEHVFFGNNYYIHSESAYIEPEEHIEYIEIDKNNTSYELTTKKPAFNTAYLKKYSENIIGLDENKIINDISNSLKKFISIFKSYILHIVNKLNTKTSLTKLEVFNEVTHIYSFNYSNTPYKIYGLEQCKKLRFIHGEAGHKTQELVMGIDELNHPVLKRNKAYQFVKYYQKLVNDTHYKFLKADETFKYYLEDESYLYEPVYEIHFWGHSLDISDKDYIQEVFSFFNQNTKHPAFIIIVYYHSEPHKLIANLIHILGKEIIEELMKNEWLKFEKSPDIYDLNFTN